jgi:hypothetical protein
MRRLEELVGAIGGTPALEEMEARRLIAHASDLNVDLLLHLSHSLAIPLDQVYARAAQFLHLPFSPVIPQEPGETNSPLPFSRIGDLGSKRALNSMVFDRRVTFAAPTAAEMIAMADRRRREPQSLKDICIVPPGALRTSLVQRGAGELLSNARQMLAQRWPRASAHLDLGMPTRLGFVLVLTVLVLLAGIAPFQLQSISLVLLLLIFLPNAWLRLAAIFETPDMVRTPMRALLNDAELPVYSVLIPLREEAHMVPQLAKAMRALDYPPQKLDIKFVVESVSTRTIAAVEALGDDPRFELIVVPEAMPHTKPKALNFGLPMVRGEFVVVYDAEDIPEPDQLRRAATSFNQHPHIDCLQAELRVDNAGESWLSALFAAEYSGLFGVMLPALARWRFPVPLGGTSNHFRMQSLLEVGGWDAFNVTEDADLGVRLSRLRYRVQTLPTRTFEEAPVTLGAWMAQRTRWMKGWMQTYIVHNHRPLLFLRDAGWRNFLAFQFYVGGMVLSAPLHLVFLIALLVRLILSGQTGMGGERQVRN